MSPSPPDLFLRFLRWFCHPKLLKYIEGDLMELYEERVKALGKRKADVRFVIDVLLLFRPGIIKPTSGYRNSNSYTMYKSYFKIGWRNLLRNKGYSFINIGGLATGMAVAMMIGLWIYDELSFNRYHDNYETIAQVYRMETWDGETGANTAQVTGLGTLLKTEYGSHFKHVVMVRARTEERVIASGERKFTQSGYFMQPEGGEMFGLKMKYGVQNGLKDMKSILLSESLAKKLFGNEDPLNKVVAMDARWDLKVTGVYEDLPKSSVFHDASYFAPLDLYLNGWSSLNAWDNYNMYTYVQIHPEGNFEKISSLIKDCTLPHLDAEQGPQRQEMFLHPMKKWHLYSEFENGVLTTSKRMLSVRYYGIIGAFVLLLACINFMNLSTARSGKRAKEVGVRKSIGSQRSQLIQQFYGESFLVALIAFTASVLLVSLCLPWFNSIADKDIVIPWMSFQFWLSCIGFITLTGLLAGSYPALYLSAFKPVKVLKGVVHTGTSTISPRKALVVIQLTVSITLSIGTIIIHEQIQFVKDRPVGYSRENLIGLRAASPEYQGKYLVLRDELKKTGVVEEMAEANYPITDIRGWNSGFAWEDVKYERAFNTIFVTHEYGKTIGLEFMEGRDFSRAFASDSSGILINESASRILGIEHPVGEELTWSPQGNNRGTFKILGVVKDMVKGSPYELTQPSIIFLSEDDMQWLYVRMDRRVSPHVALPKIEKVFASLIPSAPFDYTFADDAYDAKFREGERISRLAAIFSVLAIFISCLGLFGLAAFSAEQRTKEIGIRKVLGASVANLWRMLSKDFMNLTAVSCLIAVPIAWYLMNNWLLQSEYRVVLTWHVFAASCLGGITVTLLTVSFQAVKAALANPVNSLRSE